MWAVWPLHRLRQRGLSPRPPRTPDRASARTAPPDGPSGRLRRHHS